jgi:hypothetical protein
MHLKQIHRKKEQTWITDRIFLEKKETGYFVHTRYLYDAIILRDICFKRFEGGILCYMKWTCVH